MHGDRAEDFALLLSHLYNPSSLVFKRHNPNTPLAIAGAVRLADKYLIELLHRCLVQQVCQDWPVTLDDYDIEQGEIDSLHDVALGNLDFKFTTDGGRIPDVIPEPTAAILFSQEFGCRQILPAAFYHLALILVWDYWSSTSPPIGALARWPLLSKEDLLRCMYGYEELGRYRPSVSDFLSSQCECEETWEEEYTGTPCHQFLRRLIDVVVNRIDEWHHADPLRALPKCMGLEKMLELEAEVFPEGLCLEFEFQLCVAIAAERKKIWEQLPQWFKLE